MISKLTHKTKYDIGKNFDEALAEFNRIAPDRMDFVSLFTINCIVTNEPAHFWTGHVLAAKGGSSERPETLSIIAGFKDRETYENHSATYEQPEGYGIGYFGDYKEEMGVIDGKHRIAYIKIITYGESQ